MIVKNKYSGDQFIELKDTNLVDAETTLNRAKKAFQEMKELPSFERYEALLRVSKELENRREEFAKIISNEAGKPIKYSRGEARRASVTMLFSAEESKRIYGETIPMDVESRGKNRYAYYNRVPIGPVFAITPFNDPLNLVAHKVGPALAAGNSIVNKPASLTPYSGYRLNEIVNNSGLPEYAMQTVVGSGGGEVTNYFLNSEDVKMVTFTGGVEAADRLIKKAGIKKYSMELGSNSPVIVWKDADLELATDAIVDAAMESQGQNCIHSQRILIHREIYDDLSKRLVEKVAKLKVGDPLDDSTDIGPMIAESEAIRVEKEVNNAVTHGAEVLIGGKRNGRFYQPTLMAKVSHDMGLWHNEIFGPVSILQPIEDFEDAITMANDVPYGLQAGIYTNNLDIAMKAIQKLDFGAVLINDTSDFRVDVMPFGGMKLSGLGREGIRFAIEEMTEIKLAIFRK